MVSGVIEIFYEKYRNEASKAIFLLKGKKDKYIVPEVNYTNKYFSTK